MVIDRFFEVAPNENVPADVGTVVLIAHDEKNLCIGVKCFDPDIPELRTSLRRRDRFVESEDAVSIILDPLNSKKGGYMFQINASGVQFDSYYNWDLNQMDMGIDPVWYPTTNILADCWYAEIATPFHSLQKVSPKG